MFHRVLHIVVSAFVATSLLVVAPAAADTPFEDVPESHLFADQIHWLAARGTTAGCNPPTNDLFCPDQHVTRGQMAAFLARALELAPVGGDSFIDDNASVFEADIEKIAAAGITKGCNPPLNDRFCLNTTLTRAEMAAFLVRGLHLDARGGDRFVDDDESVFEHDIELIAAAGITKGCNPPANDHFCPDQSVTRGQMAAFLYRALTDAGGGPELLPDSRRVTWDPGIPGGPVDLPIAVSVADFGASGDGSTDDSSSFQSAIDALPPTGGVVFVPAGVYRLGSTVRLGDGAVLRGAGADGSRLEFDLGGAAAAAIEMVASDAGTWRSVSSGFQKGSTTLTLDSAAGITAPGFAEIQQSNDPAVMYTDPAWNVGWAEDSVGEMVKIVAVSGNRVTLEKPLHITYRAELDPVLRTHDLVERAGVERLAIERLDQGDGHTIFMKNTAYSWVREIESTMTVRSHVAAASTYGCEIRDSSFIASHDRRLPGHGYGINLEDHVTSCLVENNAFESLRHSMMVQLGANANVFGYNYSRDSHDADGRVLPDISVHGHFPFMNLFEGNIVDEIGISDWWGPAGPGNTLLRNCVETEGVFVEDHSHTQNIIGNVLTGSPNTVRIAASVNHTFVHGNFEGGSVIRDPEVSIETIPDSYYLAAAPNFYGRMPWPSTGSDHATSCMNPARARLESDSS